MNHIRATLDTANELYAAILGAMELTESIGATRPATPTGGAARDELRAYAAFAGSIAEHLMAAADACDGLVTALYSIGK